MRKRLVFAGAAIVVAIAGGFAIKAGRGAAAVPASAAMAANAPDAAASEVPLDFTPNEASKPLQLALPQVVEFSGPLVAPNTAIVRAKATGTLLSLDVQEGQRVKAGEPIGRIDVSDLQSKVAERAANLAAVRTTLAQAQRTHDSNIGLANDKFISTIALENSKSALESAKAQVAAAEATLSSAQVALRERKSVV